MVGLLDGVARRLLRRGLRQGLLEGSTTWLVVAAIAWLARLLLRPEAPRIVREELAVGETLTVTHVAPRSGRKARQDPDEQ
jgi:hypothetical protein